VREPPASLSTETLRACLRGGYGLAVAELAFLPLGYDSSAWVYRADGRRRHLFPQGPPGVTNAAGLLVPRYLQEQGIARVVAPLPTLGRAGNQPPGDRKS
jgi:spectinomycin phosphotransferase